MTNRKIKGTLYLVAGPSGAGKNTLINLALEKDKLLTYMPSITTRPMRKNEQQGKPYYFVSESEFQEKKKAKSLLEWQHVNGYLYGSSFTNIKEYIDNGHDVITDMEIYGIHKVLFKIPFNVCTIFVYISPEHQEERITKRNKESVETIDARLGRTKTEMAAASMFDYLVYNEELSTSSKAFNSIIEGHRARKIFINFFSVNQGNPLSTKVVLFKICLPDGEWLYLPKTILKSLEIHEVAFGRLMAMIRFKTGIELLKEDYLLAPTKTVSFQKIEIEGGFEYEYIVEFTAQSDQAIEKLEIANAMLNKGIFN